MNHIVNNNNEYLCEFIGSPYLRWLPNKVSSEDGLFSNIHLHVGSTVICSQKFIDSIKRKGINCAGLFNLVWLFCNQKFDDVVDIRGTQYWYNFFNQRGSLKKFDKTKSYPMGTILLRKYKDVEDQGHMAIVSSHKKPYNITTIIHACNPEGVIEGSLKYSNSVLKQGNEEGYHYVILPSDYIGNENLYENLYYERYPEDYPDLSYDYDQEDDSGLQIAPPQRTKEIVKVVL